MKVSGARLVLMLHIISRVLICLRSTQMIEEPGVWNLLDDCSIMIRSVLIWA